MEESKTQVPDVVKRTIRTFVQVFVGLFLVDLIGFLHLVQEWAAGTGDAPDISLLVQAALAAASAAAVAAVTFIQNLLEDIGLVKPLGKGSPQGLKIEIEPITLPQDSDDYPTGI